MLKEVSHDPCQPILRALLKRLQLGPMAATLPERIALARREQLDYTSFLEIILSDEVNRRARPAH